MRKLAPVFFSSVVLLASGSALALGDMHKHKNAPSTSDNATSQTYNNDSKASSAPSSSSDNASTSGTSGSSASKSTGLDNATSHMSASGRANESATNTPAETHYGDSSDSKAKSKSIGDRCDKSVHATLPADCKMTGARQSNATSSTQGASGGPAGSASGAGASGSAAGSGAGASGSGGSSK